MRRPGLGGCRPRFVEAFWSIELRMRVSMRRVYLAVLGLLIGVVVLSPVESHAMDRTLMDRLLTLAKSQPNSAEFRDALVKQLTGDAVTKGEAFDSNGPDFIWAIETAGQPTIVIDDKPAGPMRRSAGSNLWFFVSQLKVGTGHRFHYV